jgi:hypothetical protein
MIRAGVRTFCSCGRGSGTVLASAEVIWFTQKPGRLPWTLTGGPPGHEVASFWTIMTRRMNADAFMRGIASALAGLIPGARSRVLEGQGHDADPDALAPALEEFFVD